MASSPSRSSSNWPTLFVAGLLVISTGGFVAHQKGWIPPVVWKRAHQVVLAISGQLPDPAANNAADSGKASLGEEVPDELDARLADDDTPAQPDRVVRPKTRTRSREIPDDIYSDPESVSSEPPRPDPLPAPRRTRGSTAPRSTEADAALALADGEAFVDDVAERPAPKRPAPSRTPPNRSASVTEPARPAPPAVNEAPPDGATAPAGDLVEIADIEKLIAEEQDVLALQEMTRRYWKMPAERELLRPRMEELSNRIYFSPQPHYFEPHVIQNTEQLRQVAPKYSLSWQYLARLNNTDPKRIRPGQRLKVAPGPFHALVTIRSHELIIHNNGCYVKRYRIGAGKDRSTPIGTFKVLGKETNPTYYGPEGVVKADDPNNPLGERWVDIGNSFGVHGTNEPDSIGQDKSRGCIRMTNEDVAEVYDFLVIGSEVKIQR